VRFGEPLDHALAERLVNVLAPDGQAVPGRTAMMEGDRGWRFVPTVPWAPGRHQLRVGAALEDLAGNSVARVFDADLAAGERAAVEGQVVVRPFEPR
jgi:hypothetical protein